MRAALQYALGRQEAAIKIGDFYMDLEQAWILYDTGRWTPDEYEELPTRLRVLLAVICKARTQVDRIARMRSSFM